MLKLTQNWPFLLATIFCICLVSCKPHSYYPVQYETSIYGVASISSNPVKNGSEVDLFINNSITTGSITISSSSSVTINGKEIGVPDVHYYIDGQEVGHSNDKDAKFVCKYTMSNLKVGEHTLSAEAVPQEKGTKFNGSYESSTFVVEE